MAAATRRTKITVFLTALIILLTATTFVVVVNKNRPTAEEADILWPSLIIVHFNENGTSAKGLARFGGDCSNDYYPTQTGGVSCALDVTTKKSTGVDYEISGIIFQSFTSKRTISLPLRPRLYSSEPLLIPRNRTVSLLASIEADGSVTMKVMQNGQLVDLPPEVGLFLP